MLDLKALRAKTIVKPTGKGVVPAPKTLTKVATSQKPQVPRGKLKLNLGARKKIEPQAVKVHGTETATNRPTPQAGPPTEKAKESPILEGESTPSPLSGESPASDPALEVDESLMSQQERFIANVERIDTVIHDKELLGSVLEDMMLELSENPDYKKFMSDSHLESMMRGMMETFAIVKASKAKTSKAKTGSRKKKGKPLSDTATDMLAALEMKDGKLDISALGGIKL